MTQLQSTFPLALAGALLLAGCAGQAVKPGYPAGARVCDAASAEAACAAAIAAATAGAAPYAAADAADAAAGSGWAMQGRAAISTGSKGGNARIEWQQHDAARYTVTLSAPVTRQSWRLEAAPGQATLAGLDGGPRSGPDAARLLREATGWDIPVDALRHWLRGNAAAGTTPTRYVFAADGALIGLEQDGWRIDFTRVRPDALPARINAERDDSRVRLVIDQWGDGAGG